ncbi:MAG: hypothetical protein KGL39_38030 [Patescibacteria group bacterium]|nr:hypothetical protein [Patescibacteria group bacterium]
MAPRVEGDTPTHTAVIDWDGTAVPAVWPARPTEFMPGFVKNMKRLHRAGVRLVIFSARLSPWDPWTGARRDPSHVFEETQYVRDMLDKHGLGFIDIWTKDGKPGASVYVDDKAERYGGRPGSWDKVTDKILLRLGKEEAVFPVMDAAA